ncbi:hypothetical protein B0H17DRAFT_1070832 [Mycena rosella]|uniref:Uncharacterized protein n=1 Tax=Mycena rosella TaxID=1033263 RepID=A0AAD7DAQ0_MYCRO|nr:hypothetical protein B0H17DRAFT_1070832 [Mycena rosella]
MISSPLCPICISSALPLTWSVPYDTVYCHVSAIPFTASVPFANSCLPIAIFDSHPPTCHLHILLMLPQDRPAAPHVRLADTQVRPRGAEGCGEEQREGNRVGA